MSQIFSSSFLSSLLLHNNNKKIPMENYAFKYNFMRFLFRLLAKNMGVNKSYKIFVSAKAQAQIIFKKKKREKVQPKSLQKFY